MAVRRQKHSDPSVAYRIDDVFTYATDTCCDEGTIEFAKECRWLVHECWLDRDDYREKLAQGHPDIRAHSHADGVAEIARRAQVSALILGHLNPTYSEERLRLMAEEAAAKFPATLVLDDGDTLT